MRIRYHNMFLETFSGFFCPLKGLFLFFRNSLSRPDGAGIVCDLLCHVLYYTMKAMLCYTMCALTCQYSVVAFVRVPISVLGLRGRTGGGKVLVVGESETARFTLAVGTPRGLVFENSRVGLRGAYVGVRPVPSTGRVTGKGG